MRRLLRTTIYRLCCGGRLMSNMRTILPFLVLIVLRTGFAIVVLAGCARPDYVVSLAEEDGRACAGFMQNERTIWTAGHCQRGKTLLVTTQTGRIESTIVEGINPYLDIAILVPVNPISLSAYAEFAQPQYGEIAYAYGACRELGIWPRPMFYLGSAGPSDFWYSFLPICGGDSGGPVVQKGYVVGMVQSVSGDYVAGRAWGHWVQTYSPGGNDAH